VKDIRKSSENIGGGFQLDKLVAERLREVRRRAGFSSIGELYRALDATGIRVSRPYLGRLENGDAMPTLGMLESILRVCGSSLREFLGFELMGLNEEQQDYVSKIEGIKSVNIESYRALIHTIDVYYNYTTKKSEITD